MRVILSAMGRTFLRDAGAAFFVYALGIMRATDFISAKALAIAASYGILAAGFRGLRVYAPGISTAVARLLHVPVAYAEVVITGLTTLISGTIVGVTSFFEAGDLKLGSAAFIAAEMGVLTSLLRLGQAWTTPGEPGPISIETPPQPVPPAAISTPMTPDTPNP